MEKDDGAGEVIDFSSQKSLGSCPKCGGSVFELEKYFVCEKSVSTEEVMKALCDFKVSQTILQQPISHEQLGKLLDSGKTDFLDGFTSTRTNKLFRARLCWDVKANTVNWEFAPQVLPAASKPAKKAKADEPAKQKSSNAMHKATSKFFSKHQSASAEFLENLFKLENTLVGEGGPISYEIENTLQTVEQSILHKFLEKHDCPDWIGVWTAKHGRKEQQFAYLFRPSMNDEIPIPDRIGSRPPEIKRLFLNSRAAVVVTTLLDHDDDSYLTWARDIGFDREIKVSNLAPEYEDDYVPTVRGQVGDWLDSVLDPITDALWKEYVPDKGACTVLQGEMARCIGRLEGEYWKNGMMNMGGFLGNSFYENMVDNIKETVLSRNSFSSLVRRVIGFDASIVKGASYAKIINLSLFQESNVELSLRRLKNVVAAWCLRNKEPIPYSE